MTISPVSTSAQYQLMLQSVLQQQNSVNQSEQQVSSGLVSTTYGGLGDKTYAVQAAQSQLDQVNGYQSATNVALTQANLQATQLTQLSSVAQSLQQDISEAVANGDASTLMSQAEGLYEQTAQILNSQDANGNYIFGGNNAGTPPLTPTTLSQLASLSSSSAAFANGDKTASVQVAQGETVQVGMLASNIGSSLIAAFQSLASFNAGANGNLGTTLSTAQSSYLSELIQSAQGASQDVNTAAGQSGEIYSQLQDAQTQQQSLSTLYQGFVSNLTNVDMSTAITQLNQSQTALQAALQVTSQIGQLSLLNYLQS